MALASLVACGGESKTLPIDAYLATPPRWRGLPLPSPVPNLASNMQLVGIEASDLRRVFGEPALIRSEGGVQHLRYAFAGCSLDLFVDARAKAGLKVIYFDLRPDPLYGNGKADCERFGSALDQSIKRLPHRELPPVESF